MPVLPIRRNARCDGPAPAGIFGRLRHFRKIPAYAGMTSKKGAGMTGLSPSYLQGFLVGRAEQGLEVGEGIEPALMFFTFTEPGNVFGAFEVCFG